MVRRSFDTIARVSPSLRRLLMRTWYETLVMLDHECDVTFMNYGYSADPDASEITLSDREQVNRYCIQLYHHVVASIELTGLDVVEVGSGRGGGASYVTRYLKPKSMVGIDFSRKAIEFCRKYYSIDRLSFVHGDAEHLPLADGSVDIVINLESSHCYGSMTRFLEEVYRVLRCDGYFLFSDHRDQGKTNLLREQLKDSRLTVVRENDITLNVVRALELDNDRKARLIVQKCPRILKRQMEEFAAMRGTKAYETFKSGHSRYLSFILHKGKEHQAPLQTLRTLEG
jgi:ubiquinone/menaquinone biosynthesis C-methylase UbiE